jgi:inorganic pyrophosphatase
MRGGVTPQRGDAVRVRIEVPRGGLVKRRSDGRIDYVSPLPCPFNYGSLPGTRAPDGDPIDAVLLGPRRAEGDEVEASVIAVVRFVDAGADDPKLVCAAGAPSPRDLRLVAAFFRFYAVAKAALNRARGIEGRTAYDGLAR